MMVESVEKLSRDIDVPTLDRIAEWMRSDAGRLIHKAELQSADWSEDEFEKRQYALSNDSAWNEARQKLIRRVIDAAATVAFVTALHSETSALVLQVSDCDASEASRALLKERIQKDRRDESFYAVFLRNNIHMTAAMIFKDISDEDLESFIRHSQSAAGRAWRQSLLKTVRQVLDDRHAPIQQFLATSVSE